MECLGEFVIGEDDSRDREDLRLLLCRLGGSFLGTAGVALGWDRGAYY